MEIDNFSEKIYFITCQCQKEIDFSINDFGKVKKCPDCGMNYILKVESLGHGYGEVLNEN